MAGAGQGVNGLTCRGVYWSLVQNWYHHWTCHCWLVLFLIERAVMIISILPNYLFLVILTRSFSCSASSVFPRHQLCILTMYAYSPLIISSTAVKTPLITRTILLPMAGTFGVTTPPSIPWLLYISQVRSHEKKYGEN